MNSIPFPSLRFEVMKFSSPRSSLLLSCVTGLFLYFSFNLTILFAKIDQLRDKTDEHHNNLLQRVYQLERKVWTAFGVAVTIAFFVSNYADFFSKFTPNDLTTSYNSVIIEKTSRDI